MVEIGYSSFQRKYRFDVQGFDIHDSVLKENHYDEDICRNLDFIGPENIPDELINIGLDES